MPFYFFEPRVFKGLKGFFIISPRMRLMENKKIKVLIVEDNPGDVRLLSEMFRYCSEGEFKLMYADCLEKAFRWLNTEKMDFILLDLFLPDAFGLETIRKIREKTADSAIIVLTGSYDESMAVGSFQLGANHFLLKDRLETGALLGLLSGKVQLEKSALKGGGHA